MFYIHSYAIFYPVVHGFRQAMYDVEEGSQLNTDFTLNVVGTTQIRKLSLIGTITATADGTSSEQHKI